MIWQEDANAEYFTDEVFKCDVCGKKATSLLSKTLIETHPPSNPDDITLACFDPVKQCFIKTAQQLYLKYPDDTYLNSRAIVLKHYKNPVKREPTGLSLRYKIMKRDGFQCVFCGASGKTAQLEVDHIIPIANGGLTIPDNLQILCFNCNRGKRDN